MPDLKVFGPAPLQQITERLFGQDGAFDIDLRARTQDECSLDLYHARGGLGVRKRPAPKVTELAASDVVLGDSWTIRAAPVAHFDPILTCYAYRLDHGKQSIVYSGDTGPTRTLVQLADGCDLLIHMCHYRSGTAPSPGFARSCMGHMELAEAAKEARARTVVLTHITEQIDRPGVMERLVAEMAQVFQGDIMVARDLLEVPIGGAELGKLD